MRVDDTALPETDALERIKQAVGDKGWSDDPDGRAFRSIALGAAQCFRNLAHDPRFEIRIRIIQ